MEDENSHFDNHQHNPPHYGSAGMSTSINNGNGDVAYPMPYPGSDAINLEGKVDEILNQDDDPECKQQLVSDNDDNENSSFPPTNHSKTSSKSSSSSTTTTGGRDELDETDDIIETCLNSSQPNNIITDSNLDSRSIDAEIAQKLSNLSLQERDQVLYDIQ